MGEMYNPSRPIVCRRDMPKMMESHEWECVVAVPAEHPVVFRAQNAAANPVV